MSRKDAMQRNDALETRSDEHVERVQQRQVIAPLVDIYENDNELLLIADVPGVNEKSLNIKLDKDQLTIEGRREDPDRGRPLAGEYHPMDFHRTFLVHESINVSKISAELKQGVLKLHLPKAEGLRPRQIMVKAE